MHPTTHRSPARSFFIGYGILALGWMILICVPLAEQSLGDVALPPPTAPVINGLWLVGHLVLLCGYVGLLVTLYRNGGAAPTSGRTLLLALPFFWVMLMIPPIGSADVYHYSFYARIMNHYGANPYFAAIADFPQDPNMDWTVPHWRTSAGGYGPLLMVIVAGIDLLTGGDFHWTTAGIRLMMTGAALGAVGMGGWMAKGRPEGMGAAHWVPVLAFNPLLCFEAANTGHSDALVMFFLVLAMAFLVRGHHRWVMPALAFSFLIKPVALIVAPFVLRHLWAVRGWRVAVGGSVAALAIVIGAYALFLPFNPIHQIAQVDLPGAWWFHMGPVPMVSDLVVGHVPIRILQVVYVIGWCLVFFMVRVDTVARLNMVAAGALGGYLALCGTWVMPWYLLWLLPPLLLTGFGGRLGMIITVTAMGLLAYFLPMGLLAVVLVAIAGYARFRDTELFVG